MNKLFKRQHLHIIVLVVAVTAIFLPPIICKVYYPGTDFPPHIQRALNMVKYGRINPPHLLWHVFLVLIHKASLLTPEVCAVIISIMSFVVLSLIIHQLLRKAITPRDGNPLLCNALVLARNSTPRRTSFSCIDPQARHASAPGDPIGRLTTSPWHRSSFRRS